MRRMIMLLTMWALFVPSVLHAQDKAGCATTGYFTGTATSRQAGELQVSLNLRCGTGGYEGELVTPVGTFVVRTGLVRGKTLELTITAGSDQGTLELEIADTSATGSFVFGDDSGPVKFIRLGDAKRPGSDLPRLDLTIDQWREDLHYFATELPKQHANAFYHTPRQQFDSEVAQADRAMPHVDGDEAYVALDRIANAIGDGHTFVQWPDDLAHFPLLLRLFPDGYRVTGVQPGDERALGAHAVAIDGVPLARAVAALRPLTPAAETRILGDIRIEDFLVIGMLLHGTGVIHDRKSRGIRCGMLVESSST